MMYRHAILGGTFDHFHRGHQAMIQKAFAVADRVSIGITTEEMYGSKALSQHIQDFITRRQALEDFLNQNNWSDRAVLLPITTKYGSTLTDPTIEAIVVSPETEVIAQTIVPERIAKGLSKMEIITVPFVMAEDGEPISSVRIRRGEIDKMGHSYLTFFLAKSRYYLPDSLRKELQQPIGQIHHDVKALTLPKDLPLITVGDIVSASLLDAGIQPHIAFVDFRTQRQDIDQKIINEHFNHVDTTIHNPHGTINPDVAYLLTGINLNVHKVVRVIGEEDLLTLPALLLLPLGSLVIYGQYGKGMVVVEITEEIKKLAKKLVERF